ncbi:MAG: DJ-1/PfpI family protein [Muribaculaceae bacterium]|nr:DJ-1/PfpI family protein [Muribaculaceae bacterium]
MKKSYVFLAKGFEEIEALTVVDVMRRAGMPVEMIGPLVRDCVRGAHGVEVMADDHVSNVDLDDAEWLICPGGMPGATNLADSFVLTDMLVEHAGRGGLVAAICASPAVVLAPIGVLNGRKAVCYPGMEVDGYGVQWQPHESVVTDGNIVTGRGPASAAEFTLALVRKSLGEAAAAEVAAGMLLNM